MPVPAPSRTAIGAAILRAAHLLIDEEPRLLDDHLALSLAGLEEADLRHAIERMRLEFTRYCDEALADEIVSDLRSAILLRNRYAEDRLRESMNLGTKQYVLLGAGLDTFAHRCPELTSQLEIFELDLPDTLQWKRKRLQEMAVDTQYTPRYVATDFKTQTPLQVLDGHGYNADEPALFSWLGVTSYLDEETVYATLANLVNSAPGSRVVFSYGTRPRDERGQKISDALKASVKARAEPAASHGFDPELLAGRMRRMGYTDLEDLDIEAMDARYFRGRRDGLRAPRMIRMMSADVGR